jgi:hypothetical protein
MSTAISVIALVLAALVVACCVVVLVQVRALRDKGAALEAKVDALVPGAPMAPDLVATFGAGPRRMLAVEILNPIELASTKVKAAGLLGAVRPALLTKIVYDQAVKQVVDQLETEGVLADVRVHAAR